MIYRTITIPMAPAAPSQTVGASWGILGHLGSYGDEGAPQCHQSCLEKSPSKSSKMGLKKLRTK